MKQGNRIKLHIRYFSSAELYYILFDSPIRGEIFDRKQSFNAIFSSIRSDIFEHVMIIFYAIAMNNEAV